MDLHEVYKNSGLGKWFHGESANKTPGWDRYNSEGKIVGECGDAKKGDSYSACLSKQKAERLGKKGISSFVKRKRAAQSEAGRGEKGSGGKGQKPINVKTGAAKMDECVECNNELEIINEAKNKPNDPEKWSACKSAAKSKFDVYPSAYANAWASKCYKKKGGTWRSLKEEIKVSVKENVISTILESKHAPRGASHQRPKSWNKGVKSGSEKRKSREEGKREARELSENQNWISAAHDAFSGYLSPADITTHFKDKSFSSAEEFKSAVQQLADDHADRFISTQDREGKNPETAMRAWSDKVVNRFDDKIAKQQKAAEDAKNIKITPQRGGRSSGRGYWLQGPNGPDDRVWSHDDDPDAYDKRRDGYYEESVYHKLKTRLIETPGWNPPEDNEFSAEADDMMLDADEETRKQEEMDKFYKELRKKLRKS